jgi:hypothetical protein
MCVYVIYLNIYIFNLDILVKAYVCVKIGFYLEKLPVVGHREL